MKEPIRVLQVLAGLDRGGAEGLVMNLFRRMNRDRVQFDFAVNDNVKEYAYEAEALSLGARVYRLPRFTMNNFTGYIKAWKLLLSEHPEWKLIHCHHTAPAFLYLKIIKKYNRTAIVHSHTGSCEASLKAYMKYLMRLPIRFQADYLFACSQNAADWMFGRRNSRVHLMQNGIELEKYRFDEELRNQVRGELGLNGKYVIGHIGNFSKVKNIPFILELFEQLHGKEQNIRLLLVGRFENDPDIRDRISRLSCADDVIVTGVRPDIPRLMMAMDVFLFPSLFEGLPVTLIEAQASGLKCIVSDTVTKEVQITELIEFLSLKKAKEDWIAALLKYQKGYERKLWEKELSDAGYDIQQEAERMERFYCSVSETRG